MKKIFFLTILGLVSNICLAQTKQETDSLHKVLTSGQDSAKVLALALLSYYEFDPVRRLELVNEALELARAIQFKKGEAQCYHMLGNHFSKIADYAKSLEYHIKALQLREKYQYVEGIAVSEHAIGEVYSSLGNDKTALAYYFKAAEQLRKGNVQNPGRWVMLYRSLGAVYERQNKLDSALIYYNRSYENDIISNFHYYLSYTLTALGNVHAAMGNTDLAFSFYKKSLGKAMEYNDTSAMGRNYLALSKLFIKTNHKDSAIYYTQWSLAISRNSQLRRLMVDAARQLAQLYKATNDKEALRYYEMAMDTKDSIFSASNAAQIQALIFSEQERQREINENNVKEAAERKHNLQYAAIAIGLITFIILFLLLSRSIIVKTKFIEFFGVLGLLAVFEFINLFIHPYLAHATNDSPVLMLIVLIAIGALLIPLHHKIEKWITKIMVEKNKKIRLEAAKKTIQQLEG
ncbi:MAG: hypothetical protein NVSMB45_14860 [Ginsengibacter sp.]